METNILKRIFFDEQQHWNKLIRKNGKKIRPNVLKESEKFHGCGKIVNGFKLFVCEGSHDTNKEAYCCNGRFFTSCSVCESEEWSHILSNEVNQGNHRYVIFTIVKGLRDVFLLHRKLL